MPLVSDSAFSSGNIMRRLKQLERKIHQLSTARRLESATIGEGGLEVEGSGRITISEGGSILVFDSAGNELFYVGGFQDRGYGLSIWRPDGSKALDVIGDTENDPRTFTIYDRQENEIFSEDETGRGISSPWISYPIQDSVDLSTRTQVTSSSFQEVSTSRIFRLHPEYFVTGEVIAAGNAEGAYDVIVEDRSDGSLHQMFTQTIGPGGSYSFGETIDPTPYVPNFLDSMNIHLRIRKTGGDASSYWVGRLNWVTGLRT